jgi:hypothetical protein
LPGQKVLCWAPSKLPVTDGNFYIFLLRVSAAELPDGEGGCLPEDCDVFPGYANLKQLLADRKILNAGK